MTNDTPTHDRPINPQPREIWPPDQLAAYYMTLANWVPGNSDAAQEAAKKADPVWVLEALRTATTADNTDMIKEDYNTVACSDRYQAARREYIRRNDALAEAALHDSGHRLKDTTAKRNAALYEAIIWILQAGDGLDPWDVLINYTRRKCHQEAGGEKVRRRSDERALRRWKAAWIEAHPEAWDEFMDKPTRRHTVDLEELRKITNRIHTGRR